MSRWGKHFVLDVESDGPCPGLFNMISFGIVSLADPNDGYTALVKPVVASGGIPEARNVSGISFARQQDAGLKTNVAMGEARNWIDRVLMRYGHAVGSRVTFWSDNPAFDWQWWNYYWYLNFRQVDNPAGFSARRIGDLAAGIKGRALETQGWKKLRETLHNHDPLMDARGNAEALRTLLTGMGETLPSYVRAPDHAG